MQAKLIGINHATLEVSNGEEALAFYGRIFDFTLHGKGKGQTFIDIGASFIALADVDAHNRDGPRAFGRAPDPISTRLPPGSRKSRRSSTVTAVPSSTVAVRWSMITHRPSSGSL